ncbi:RNA-directed DNA polymerase from mobile element jockey [Caerostris darwini]|uniref:RNA-directed DNA polymerase from mobile element jockey n=1 Tax=Caerostris darwini TaxID=1538125 RepID=A0AAV4V9I3_9ARAC|nr:RNA-directed DNA polymerase from mobile element jockey [Caerostris darwini]
MPTIDILEEIIKSEKKKQAAAEKTKRQKRGTDSEGFTLPPKRHTSRLPSGLAVNQQTDLIDQSINNVFSSLADTADAGNDQEMAARVVIPKPPKIPPIFIKCRSDWRNTLSILRAEVDDPIRAQISGQFVRINVETEDNFRHVIRFLDFTGMEYKSFMLRNERPVKVVLRGLPASTPENDIASELNELGFGVHKITK